MAKRYDAITSGEKDGEKEKEFNPIDIQSALIECISLSSTCSGPEGFRNRRVELQDGFLIVVSEEETISTIVKSPSPTPSVCTSIMGNSMDDWENVYLKHSTEIVNPKDGFVFTPLHVVKELGKLLKMEVHIEHYILKDPVIKDANVIYRVDIMFGGMRGIGQCTSKQMARQLAAIDLYEKVQLQQAELGYRPSQIPRSGLLPGWRVDSLVYPLLFDNVCKGSNLGKPSLKILPPEDGKPGKFTCICRVGSDITRAEHDHPWLAKKLAAKQMYEILTGNEFPIATTLMGSDVLGFPQMKLLGFNPKITNLKRKWMVENRIQDTQVVLVPNEPNDGEMDDVEEEAQLQLSKRVKLNEMKGTLSVTIRRDYGNTPNCSRVVSSTDNSTPPVASTSQAFTTISSNQDEQQLSEDDFFDGEDDELIIYAEDDELDF